MVLFFTGRAELVEVHKDITVRSTNQSFELPKVLRLLQNFKYINRVKFNRNNVFLRDEYTCQYCGVVAHPKLLSFDHVLPRSRGGKTCWENIVTCCLKCNGKKADKLLHETNMRLLKIPKEPHWTPYRGLNLKDEEEELFRDWIVPA